MGTWPSAGSSCWKNFGVPGETILIAAAVHAGAGRLSMVGVGLVAFLAAVIGDNLGYVIGHFGGRALVLRYGRSSSSWW
jgi:membrane protein DedA with SNARE-associated domain